MILSGWADRCTKAVTHQPDRFDLLRLHGHIDIRLDLVALDDLAVLDRADARYHLFILDALAGRLVDLIKMNLGAALRRAIDIDVDRDKLEAQKSAPVHMSERWHS